MSQILDALSNVQLQRLVCSYRNSSQLIQIARISNIPNWYFERVIFPQECLLFEAPPEAQLEIYQEGGQGETNLVNQIVCDRLAISEPEVVAV